MEYCKVLTTWAPISVEGIIECTVRLTFSNPTVVGNEGTLRSKECSIVILDEVVVKACTVDETTAPEPAELTIRRWTEESPGILLTICALALSKVMRSREIMSNIMWLEGNIITAGTNNTCVALSKVVEGHINKEGLGV